MLTGDVKNIVIGVNEEYFFKDVDSNIEKLVRKGIETLEDQGARIQEVSIPALKYAEWAEFITSLSEAAAIHHSDLLERPDEDRKSTRLNSSHVSISYAVFCLKKK